jgi:hypothetical protein
MALTPCNTSGGTTIGVLSPLTSITAGVETLTFTPTGTGTCTFTLNDYHTNVVSNTISMTILSI